MEIVVDITEETHGGNLRRLTIVRCNVCHRLNMSVDVWYNACNCTGNPMYSSKIFMKEGEWVA